MTFRELVQELQFFVGYRILIVTQTTNHHIYHGQYCTKVQYLSLDQRTPNQGNVILCSSLITKDQIPHGATLWAKDIHHITWHHPNCAEFHLNNKTIITISRLWKLTDDPYKETLSDQENLHQNSFRRCRRSVQHHLGHSYQ